MDLQVSFTRDRFAANFAGDQVLAGVYLKVHLQSCFPVALEVADIALMLLPLAVRLHVRVQISGTRVWGIAHFADERFLSCVSEQVSLQGLIRVEAFATDLAVSHVFLVVLLLVQTQVVAGHLRDAADITGETFVVLFQVRLQELLGFEAFIA